ncbi:hypothetical protein CYMTET_50579 [Cymbomonas tetramitiformis]|uniref:Uncharacterized protein n=1 Tax=Cymbomonas tetramitiformis TaxID=36881 RepID=A0AAE0BP56_9CHLO|nr:hypothetical protein CYMTET_50579 [Cymbomonas tetramitiformis]
MEMQLGLQAPACTASETHERPEVSPDWQQPWTALSASASASGIDAAEPLRVEQGPMGSHGTPAVNDWSTRARDTDIALASALELQRTGGWGRDAGVNVAEACAPTPPPPLPPPPFMPPQQFMPPPPLQPTWQEWGQLVFPWHSGTKQLQPCEKRADPARRSTAEGPRKPVGRHVEADWGRAPIDRQLEWDAPGDAVLAGRWPWEQDSVEVGAAAEEETALVGRARAPQARQCGRAPGARGKGPLGEQHHARFWRTRRHRAADCALERLGSADLAGGGEMLAGAWAPRASPRQGELPPRHTFRLPTGSAFTDAVVAGAQARRGSGDKNDGHGARGYEPRDGGLRKWQAGERGASSQDVGSAINSAAPRSTAPGAMTPEAANADDALRGLGAAMCGDREVYEGEVRRLEELRVKPLLAHVARLLPTGACALELGALTAFSAVRLARHLTGGIVYTADRDPSWVDYLKSRAAAEGLPNLRAMCCGVQEAAARLDHCISLVILTMEVESPSSGCVRRQLLEDIRQCLCPGPAYIAIFEQGGVEAEQMLAVAVDAGYKRHKLRADLMHPNLVFVST